MRRKIPPCEMSCSEIPGGVVQLGYQHGLLWRCPTCGRIWRLQHEFSAVFHKGLWVWVPAPWFVRWTASWDRWTWAQEVGVQ